MADEVDGRSAERPPRGQSARRTAAGASFRDDLRRGLAAALPCLLTAALAAALTRFRLPFRTGDAPVAFLLIVLTQAVGYAMARGSGRADLSRHWLMALIATTVVLPAMALQAAFAREPFVALGRGSASGLIWMTRAALATLTAAFVVACGLATSAPADGSLLFVPVAAIVPAIAAAPLELNEQDALGALIVAMGVAGVAIGFGASVPDGYRPPVGAIALAGEFALLWALRRSPHFAPDHGAIVPVLAALLLTATVVALVLAPLGALTARRFTTMVASDGQPEGAARTPFQAAPRMPRRSAFTPPRNRRR
jgi:hypothetical protein